MIKNLLKLLLISSIAVTSSQALQKEQIKEQMTSKINNILTIIRKDDLTTNQKGAQIIEIIDVVFNYPLMSRIALGKKWKQISKNQRAEFSKVFEGKLKKSYIEKLELYTDQNVKVEELVPYKKGRLQLQTQLEGATDSYKVNYNFYKNKKTSDWRVYDIDLAGVSVIQTYRKQFLGLLKEKSIDELIETLKK